MKVAICGGGPLGIEAAIKFLTLGAAVTLYYRRELGGYVGQMAPLFPDFSLSSTWSQLTTAEGRNLLKEHNHSPFKEKDMLEKVPTVKEYWELYLQPLIACSGIKDVSKKAQVLSVQKRFLAPDEEVSDHSRLFDLFRVVISVSTEERVQEQIKENPEVFQRLGAEVVASLSHPLETFEDFDIVVDAMGTLEHALPFGAGGTWALGEKKWSAHPHVAYGWNFFRQGNFKDPGQMALIGSGPMAALILLFLEDWLLQKENNLVLITSEETCFAKLAMETQGMGIVLWQKLQDLLQKLEAKDKAKFVSYEEKLNEWRELEDYMRAKYPRPQEPRKTLITLCGYNVTAVDRLMDQNSFFLTLECPEFRKSKGPPLTTLSVDRIIGASGHKINRELFSGLRIDLTHDERTALTATGEHSEPGFFTLGPVRSAGTSFYSLEHGLVQIEKVLEKVLSFFSRKNP